MQLNRSLYTFSACSYNHVRMILFCFCFVFFLHRVSHMWGSSGQVCGCLTHHQESWWRNITNAGPVMKTRCPHIQQLIRLTYSSCDGGPENLITCCNKVFVCVSQFMTLFVFSFVQLHLIDAWRSAGLWLHFRLHYLEMYSSSDNAVRTKHHWSNWRCKIQ